MGVLLCRNRNSFIVPEKNPRKTLVESNRCIPDETRSVARCAGKNVYNWYSRHIDRPQDYRILSSSFDSAEYLRTFDAQL